MPIQYIDQAIVVFDASSQTFKPSNVFINANVVSLTQKAGNYTLLSTDFIINFTATATATLPLNPLIGTSYRIKNLTTTGNQIVTVVGQGGALVNGSTSVAVSKNGSIDLVYNGTNWQLY